MKQRKVNRNDLRKLALPLHKNVTLNVLLCLVSYCLIALRVQFQCIVCSLFNDVDICELHMLLGRTEAKALDY